jgi:predicted enzyme related to lactoylglutathione lyase
MTDFALVILYVDAPERSAGFYADLLGLPVIESSSTFAMLPLRPGVALGLWSRHTVEPGASATGGGGEIAFTVPDIDAVHADWLARGVVILQPPAELDFGRTFTATDPDGHRLRVFTPANN